jgi:uncharacterized protein (TIGR03086 family)
MRGRRTRPSVAPMSEISERYRTRAAALNARIEAVPDDRWSSPSPCEEWVARDVVRHVVDTSGMFLGYIDRELPAGPSVDDDPVAAWHTARDTIQAALDDPDVAATAYTGQMGPSTFEASVDRFLSADALIHTWDLARAAGLDERLDPDEVHASLEAMTAMDAQFGEMMRSSGAFGPKLEAPAGADEQTQLLALLGRKA